MLEKFSVKTRARCELLDITPLVREAARKSKAQSGVCFVYTPHTTAGIVINENADPDVKRDISKFLEKLIPKNSGFDHSEGNSDAHIKSCLCGNSKTVFIEDGDLMLGTWEGIYFAEFDGPRTREVLVKVLREV
jgi:secondary thiamine-phosphate synthase enzyme